MFTAVISTVNKVKIVPNLNNYELSGIICQYFEEFDLEQVVCSGVMLQLILHYMLKRTYICNELCPFAIFSSQKILNY